MKRVPSHYRLWVGIAIAAVLGLTAAVAAVYANGRWGGSSDASAAAAFPTKVVSGKPVTHNVVRVRRIHVPPRTVVRNGKVVHLPGHTITRRSVVTVPGLGTTVPGPTRTVTGPGGVRTVIQTVPGPTTTLPGSTVTLPGGTTTLPGTTTTLPGTTVTEAGPTTTVTETVTVTAPPPPPTT